VDVPLEETRYDARFSAPDPKHGCIVDKIREFQAILNDPSRPVEERRLALRFLIHPVGDLQQPLHVGDKHDRGGNDTQVRFFNRGSNMHRVWDSDMIERAGRDQNRWLAELAEMDTPLARREEMGGKVEEWGRESLLAARAAYVMPETGALIKSGRKLGDEYQAENVPVVKRRLYQASVRLAMVLNEAFQGE
jgi:hypothetical protein